MVVQRAPAKINLSLDVLGRRSDGYHELRSVIQAISLYDVLVLQTGREESRVIVSDPAMTGSDYSLIDRAIAAMHEYAQVSTTITYKLLKRIPSAAGLGGGSSDAAAALLGMNRLLQLGLTRAQLAEIGAHLGSDVPFFLYGGTALVEGRGERITPLEGRRQRWVLLANAGVPISTRMVFEALQPQDYSSRDASGVVLAGLRAGEITVGRNHLIGPVFRLFPTVRQIYEQLMALAPGRVGLSGSGGTVFALFESRSEAEQAQASLTPRPAWTSVAATISHWEELA
jgi:4-diphosphocytidyl-2-C-methyl-D-erythritol kinase